MERFANIPFSVIAQGTEEEYPGWQPGIEWAKQLIPGSGILVRQNMGYAPAAIALTLDLDSREHYLELQAMLGRTSVLVLRSAYTNARGETKFEDGDEWEHLPNTTLDALGPPRFELGGAVVVSATFERAFDPRTGRAE